MAARALMVIISQANLCQDHQLLTLVGGRELPRQRNETQDQILQRRGTLISLDAETSKDEWRAVCVMPYMADF
jgi:hypothetical protein